MGICAMFKSRNVTDYIIKTHYTIPNCKRSITEYHSYHMTIQYPLNSVHVAFIPMLPCSDFPSKKGHNRLSENGEIRILSISINSKRN